VETATATDYLGNEIKEGHQICFVQRSNLFTEIGYLMPHGDSIVYDHQPEEDLWEIDEYADVVNIDGKLFYSVEENSARYNINLSLLDFFTPSNCIVAIKGISDQRPI
jgi:hypothetical protein